MRSKPNPPYEDFVMRTHHTLRTTRKRHNPYPLEVDKSDDFAEGLWLAAIWLMMLLILLLVVFSLWL